jgi:hypothetical protein
MERTVKTLEASGARDQASMAAATLEALVLERPVDRPPGREPHLATWMELPAGPEGLDGGPGERGRSLDADGRH